MTNHEITLMQAGATMQADVIVKYLNEHNFYGLGLVMQTLKLDMRKDFEGKQESV